jgi:hypothetical protein
MRGTVGKLEKSTFQRYQDYANWSLDRKVMVPGTRVVQAVFLHFFGEDSSQAGDVIGEPRVAHHSRICPLS